MDRGQRVGYDIQQGLAVGDALVITQLFQGAFVAGQLAIPTGLGGSDPNQGVEPVNAQTYAAHQGPKMVVMAQMGPFVGQNMGPCLRILGTSRGQVNGGMDQTSHAGSGDMGTDLIMSPIVLGGNRILFSPAQENEIGA